MTTPTTTSANADDTIYVANDSERTPAQTLFKILQTSGWCSRKNEFADLIRIRHSNVYAYLGAREDARRVNATMETIWAWCQQIRQSTDLVIKMEFLPDGTICFEVTGKNQVGVPLQSTQWFATEPSWVPKRREEAATNLPPEKEDDGSGTPSSGEASVAPSVSEV